MTPLSLSRQEFLYLLYLREVEMRWREIQDMLKQHIRAKQSDYYFDHLWEVNTRYTPEDCTFLTWMLLA